MNRIALITASTLVLGSVAFGQSSTVTAKIPFEFRTPSGVLPAGDYVISNASSEGSTKVASLRSAQLKKVVLVISASKNYDAKGSTAVLFRCNEDGCVLSGLRTVDGTINYNAPRMSKHAREVAVVAAFAPSVKAE
jgi:hypothetical protein